MSARDPHLGDRLAALADGDLGHDARDRALAHVAECAPCLSALEAERRLKSRLAGLGNPPVPDTLTSRLLALADAETGPSLPPGTNRPPRGRRVAVLSRPGRTVVRRSSRPAGRDDARTPRGRRARVTAFAGGVLSVAGVALGSAFVLGAPTTPAGSPIVPPVSSLTTEHAATTVESPLLDPATTGVDVSLTALGFSSTAALAPARFSTVSRRAADFGPVPTLPGLGTPTPTSTPTPSSSSGATPMASASPGLPPVSGR